MSAGFGHGCFETFSVQECFAAACSAREPSDRSDSGGRSGDVQCGTKPPPAYVDDAIWQQRPARSRQTAKALFLSGAGKIAPPALMRRLRHAPGLVNRLTAARCVTLRTNRS